MIKLVLAVHKPAFVDWCRETDTSPYDPSVRYVRDSQDLRGLGQPVEIVVADERFWSRRDALWLHADALHVQERNKDLPDPGPTSR